MDELGLPVPQEGSDPLATVIRPRIGPDRPGLRTQRRLESGIDMIPHEPLRVGLGRKGSPNSAVTTSSTCAAGIADLITALRLVAGEPFSRLRDGRWSWLLEGERWDRIMTSAIVDVAHIVCAHALSSNDSTLALWAARTAYMAAPYDEVAQLDIIQAVAAGGDDDQPRRPDRQCIQPP